MVYLKHKLSDKIGYWLCGNIWYKVYMILGGWALGSMFVSFMISAMTVQTQGRFEACMGISMLLHFLFGMWSVWYHDKYLEIEDHNEQLERDLQLNFFRDFGLK